MYKAEKYIRIPKGLLGNSTNSFSDVPRASNERGLRAYISLTNMVTKTWCDINLNKLSNMLLSIYFIKSKLKENKTFFYPLLKITTLFDLKLRRQGRAREQTTTVRGQLR